MPGALSQLGDFLSQLRTQATDKAMEMLVNPYADPAAKISQAQFPGQDWDNTQRNALRHALWIGGTARALGASPDNPVRTPIAQGLARILGYTNELPTLGQLDNPAQIRDTLHDLNNNAVGLSVAGSAKTDEEFRRILIAKAMSARAGKPLEAIAPANGRLSFDLGTPISRY